MKNFSSRYRTLVIAYQKKETSVQMSSVSKTLSFTYCCKLQMLLVNVKGRNSSIHGLDLLSVCYLLPSVIVTNFLCPGFFLLLLPVLDAML